MEMDTEIESEPDSEVIFRPKADRGIPASYSTISQPMQNVVDFPPFSAAEMVPEKNATRNKSIVPWWTMHTGRMSCHSTKKGVNYYMSIITMRCRRFPANSASDCLLFEKFRPQFSASCGANYTRICEMFSALQSASCPVSDFGNRVQIDS